MRLEEALPAARHLCLHGESQMRKAAAMPAAQLAGQFALRIGIKTPFPLTASASHNQHGTCATLRESPYNRASQAICIELAQMLVIPTVCLVHAAWPSEAEGEEGISEKSSNISNSTLKRTGQLANLDPLDMLPYALQSANLVACDISAAKKLVAYKKVHSVHASASLHSRSQMLVCVDVNCFQLWIHFLAG